MRPVMRTFVLVALLVGCMPLAGAEKLSPVDEGSREPTFAAFRRQLLAAVRRRDTRFVMSVVDPRIQNDFGGGAGIADFRRHWRLDHPERSPLWSTLDRILRLGGSFTSRRRREFCAPYIFTKFPERLDGFSYQVITGKNVPVRQEPRSEAAVVTTLSYEIVKVPDAQPIAEKTATGTRNWIRIVAPNGRRAYVDAASIWSPVGYRACFTKRGGGWRMTALIEGD